MTTSIPTDFKLISPKLNSDKESIFPSLNLSLLVQVMPKTLALSNKSLVKAFLSSSRMSSLEMYFDIFSYIGIFS